LWLRQQVRVSPGAAARLVALAQTLNARPVLDDAVCAGTMSAAQATTIAATIGRWVAAMSAAVTGSTSAAKVARQSCVGSRT